MENNLGKKYSSIAITPALSSENVISYIRNIESIQNNSFNIEFLIIRNKSLNKKGYKEFAKKILSSLKGELSCLLHFDSLDFFVEMEDVISESLGIHFTSSLLKEIDKDILLRHIENKKIFGGSCHNEKEITLAEELGLNYCLFGPVKDKCIDGKLITKGIGWDKFSNLAQKSLTKVYAIGGINSEDFETAYKNNASGVAGISMFNQSS